MNLRPMVKRSGIALGSIFLAGALAACSGKGDAEPGAQTPAPGKEAETFGSQAAAAEEMNVLKVATGSKDHKTLVAAVQAAGLVDVLASSGPYTVFAPTDAAFGLLPKGTVEGLLAPGKKKDLANILQYHVTVPVLKESMLRDGQKLGMANGDNATVSLRDGKTMINDAQVLGSVTATNGVVYVIDKVLLPSAGK